ncbi:MAG: hypothetical protein HON55_04020, partial [Legionellales bacterium]|nr:hypothetical protein [Legionellales bacterium]
MRSNQAESKQAYSRRASRRFSGKFMVELPKLETKEQIDAKQAAAEKIQQPFLDWQGFASVITKSTVLSGKVLKYGGEQYVVLSDVYSPTREAMAKDPGLMQGLRSRDITIAKTGGSKAAAKAGSKSIKVTWQPAQQVGVALDGKIIDPSTLDKAIQVRRSVGQVIRLDALRGKILKSVVSAKEYRYLIQSYKNTAELADAYNKSSAFELVDLKSKKTRIVNPFAEQLLTVAHQVIEKYGHIRNPSLDNILELADLASLDDQTVSEAVYNTLIKVIHSLKSDGVEITNLNEIAGLSRMLRLLPPGFLSEKHPDTALNVLRKVSQWLDSQFSKLKDASTQAEQLKPILEIYAQMLDALLDNKQLQKMDLANRGSSAGAGSAVSGMSMGVMMSYYRDRVLAKQGGAGLDPSGLDPLAIAENAASMMSAVQGQGLDKGTQGALNAGVKKLATHADIELKYLSLYITQGIARLA